MGMRDKIQTKLGKAFDGKLADAVNAFTGTYMGEGEWDPVAETSTAQPVTYTGRGVLAGYDSKRIDNVNIKVGDVKLIALANEVTDNPMVGHQITAPDLVTGEQVTYRVESVNADAAQAHIELQLRRS
ncbi:glutamate 5-kinase [Pseudomonas alloputida]|uniref:Glutamate 5-kinase n=1 Tax=Pseudomonas alloputida TaxID=1940621 RepID=A0AAW7HI57_9PSED|nr:glutamate 5-kinase [Pseudomonas alloputida]MCE0860688.1 glutamate 5-kinase [Pseudomonas alloputida]MCE0866712.1 glutamate 5-kinase [Pseudomonas alloputida]MCE0889846.1 glutamate 5-kinase [Pseudomonas alloputida]MCE0919057.1 glutamate 5-kinase [Pseudomonas alloputida]MCE1045572.1 glutamate 5-kinase [Pseudomonas alloputida]